MFASKSTGGFYVEGINKEDIPSDVVEITEEYRKELSVGEATGKVIVWDDDGYPSLADAAPITEIVQKAMRARMYADPISGCDRFFAEYTRELSRGNTDAAKAAKDSGDARYEDIRAIYPWPLEA